MSYYNFAYQNSVSFVPKITQFYKGSSLNTLKKSTVMEFRLSLICSIDIPSLLKM